MSVTSVNGTNDLASTLFQAIDSNGDKKLEAAEFTAFLDTLLGRLRGTATDSSSALSTAVATVVQPSGLDSAAETGATLPGPLANPPAFAGFDSSRAESARGSLKYDAYNVLTRFDPSDSSSIKKAFAVLDQMHPGAFELDDQDNLMLTGTADGYIGSRPLGYNGSSWDDAAPKQWQWFAYNVAHPGPDGRTT